MFYTRRDLGKLALAALPAMGAMKAFGAINSKFNGVQIGAITYSFRTLTSLDDIVKSYVQIGLGEMELMADHAETAAGAPTPQQGRGGFPGGGPPAGGAGRGRAELTPEQREAMQTARRARADEMRKWRLSTSAAAF